MYEILHEGNALQREREISARKTYEAYVEERDTKDAKYLTCAYKDLIIAYLKRVLITFKISAGKP